MGSSCSSAQKKKDKKGQDTQSPVDGNRRRSTDSLPYYRSSPPSSRRPSHEPAPLAEEEQVPLEVVKRPVDAVISQASTVGGESSSSPPPSSTLTGTPVVKDAPSLETFDLPDLQQFPEQVRSLLLGRLGDLPSLPPLQEIMLYVAADYHDSSVERSALAEKVFPVLRRSTAEKGYELNVVDMHFGLGPHCFPDHNLRELCIKTLSEWKNRKRLITLVLFNDNIGEGVLPRSLPRLVLNPFLDTLSKEEDIELFKKWYVMDANASATEYTLQAATVHFPDISGEDVDKRAEAIAQWQEESSRMSHLMKESLPEAQRSKFLASILEDEIKTVVTSEDCQESRRVLWMQRRFTHASKPCNGPNPDARRVDKTKVQLEDYLPDTQKMVLYVKWHEGQMDPDGDEEDQKYINELCNTLSEELTKVIDSVLEEDFLEEAQTSYRGIETPLYIELVQQYSKCQSLCSDFFGRAAALQSVQEYVQGPTNHPLVVYGSEGCGKSSFIAKCAEQCSSWLPLASVVVRFVGATSESATFEQLLRSVLEQCCALYGEHPSVAFESVEDWGSGLERLLEKVSESRPLVVMIDGIDETAPYCKGKELQWLPKELPPFVKLVLAVKEGSEQFEKLQNFLRNGEYFVHLEQFTLTESTSLVNKVLESHKRCISEPQKNLLETQLQDGPSAIYTHLLSQIALRWTASMSPPSVESGTLDIMLQYLAQAEAQLGSKLLTRFLGLLASAKQGVSDSEMGDLMTCDDLALNYVFHGQVPTVRRFPTVLWMLAKSCLNCFLSTQVSSGRTLHTLRSISYRTAVMVYLENKGHELKSSAQLLVDYFLGKWMKKASVSDEEVEERLVLAQPLAFGSNPNKRKLEELPYQVLQVEDSIRENFLFDATWLLYKVCGSDPYQLLEDIVSYEEKTASQESEIRLLTSTIQLSSYALRCDGSQFFAQIYGRLKSFFTDPEHATQYPSLKALYDTSCKSPLSSLLPVDHCLREPAMPSLVNNCISDSPSTPNKSSSFSGLYTIKGDQSHIISLSCDRGELIVWNIYHQTAIRKLVGINQPKDVKMVDQYRALVLCNRELKVYHLDQGTLLVKLKGVMNQKMAYYGLHDENYAVALSRNRMYVNMTNLTTGDLETTFKVGEDRFLNSLLVSANGRICVCGDETQKPFPLLVWDLGSRKLVYDLRIPHHEFVTRLSAISDDGHYVVSVCRELHDTAPNFIIVYDLQSGTLFKKWKPESSSCSIAISSQGGCVVNGLENTWVLVWDLSTGARRYTLRGHCAPVDQIRIEEEGNRCLTYDSRGRDRSLRVWDVAKGECLAVFTPDQEFSACELSLDGRAVVLGLKGQDTITTLLLCREASVEESAPEDEPYGDEERKHKVFDMSKEGL